MSTLDNPLAACNSGISGIVPGAMAKIANSKSTSSARSWRAWLSPFALALLVLVAYLPALRGQFIWDDDDNIINCPALRSLDGLRRIWVEPGATQQYYPLTHTSFWLDYHLWGLHPAMYHFENILLHALSAVLLWRVLRRLKARGAWLAAALFAVHPVCVESVAWITERKNAMAGVFFLVSALCAIEFWLPKNAGPKNAATKPNSTASPQSAGPEAGVPVQFGAWKYYCLALAFYVCALWGKTAVIGLPGIFLLLAWWKRKFLVRRDFVLLVPFLICGLAMALVTISVEAHLRAIGAGPDDWTFSGLQRLLIGTRAFWFYLGKIVWPHPLMFMYPRWDIQVANVLDYLPLMAIIAAATFLWRKRNAWGRAALVALGSFVLILFPVLGAFNVFFYRYSFVCDHFQYLALIGPLAFVVACISKAIEVFSSGQPLLKPAVCAALIATFGALTWSHAGVFADRETLWRDSLAHNPDSWMAHDDLGVVLSQSGRFEEADYHYHTAMTLRPNDHVAYYDLGLECAMKGDLDGAMQNYTKALEISPNAGLAHYELANVLAREEKLDDAIREYALALQTFPNFTLAHFNYGNALAKRGRLDDALAQYTNALKLDPTFALASFNLGNALAKKGNLDGAIEQYTRTLDLQPTNAHAHATLGRALAGKGNIEQAIAHYQKALELDLNSVDAMANLANALLSQKRFDEAVDYYHAALRISPESAVLHYNLAAALSRQGKSAEAQEELNRSRQLQTAQTVAK